MKKLTYKEIRDKYLDFMKQHGHSEIPNAPLIPENDPSLLFINAGMVPLVPFLMGEDHPQGTRLTNVQKCVRTIDIDEVGDSTHCTAFDMLGNWSLDDYFKDEAINFTLDFFVETLEIDINNIYASVFKGNDDVPRDEASIKTWKKIFQDHDIDAKVGKNERIQLYGKDKCWWELPAGGPCGPCSEIFYDTGKEKCGTDCHINCNCGKYVELGNNVFMEFLKKEGNYKDLGRHNVDFGGGLERLVATFQGKDSYFQTDIYFPIMQATKQLTKQDESKNETILKSQRIIVDHIKSATWIIMDGIKPGRTERGYILRRIIRRAVRHGRELGIEDNFTREIGSVAIKQFAPIYPKLKQQKNDILDVLEDEEKKFRKTIESGTKKFEEMIEEQGDLTGEDAFHLYETYGFPVEITKEMAEENDIDFDMEKFHKAFEKHKEESRAAAKKRFKGGMADTSEMSTKYHTATHLLNAALRKVVGDHIYQKGSNITPERLRFDFPSEDKLSSEQLKKVENIVNTQIEKGLEVHQKTMSKEKALKLAPYSAFAEKYGDEVKVYIIGDEDDPFSFEICGGPHVKNIKDLGTFKIIKHKSVGANVKRIRAVLE
jgi:alanyl-tRNA synthetase